MVLANHKIRLLVNEPGHDATGRESSIRHINLTRLSCCENYVCDGTLIGIDIFIRDDANKRIEET